MYRLRNRKFLIVTLFLISIYLIIFTRNLSGDISFLTNTVDFVVAPFERGYFSVKKSTNKVLVYFEEIQTLRDENKQLTEKIDILQREKLEAESFKNKNIELKEALDLKNRLDLYDTIGGNIISKSSGNWFNIFTIDVGTNDGVYENMPVIGNRGLVGKVIRSEMFTSKVRAIIDIDSSLSVRFSKKRDLAVVKGDFILEEQGLAKMEYIPDDADISHGDVIETSGIGGIYPAGILVGRVIEIRKSVDEFTKYSVVEPFVDFTRIEEVYVLKEKVAQGGIDEEWKLK